MICAAKTEEKTAPTTATPNVPPNSRATSLMADPTPALAGGRTASIAAVEGAATSARPTAIRAIEMMTGPK